MMGSRSSRELEQFIEARGCQVDRCTGKRMSELTLDDNMQYQTHGAGDDYL